MQQELKPSDVIPGDIIIFDEPATHMTVVSRVDKDHVWITHQRAVNAQASPDPDRLIPRDGLLESRLHLPYKGGGGQAAKKYTVFRFQGDGSTSGDYSDQLIDRVVSKLKIWNEYLFNFNHRYSDRRFDDKLSLSCDEEKLKFERNFYNLLRCAYRDRAQHLPKPPQKGFDCVALVVIAFQICELEMNNCLQPDKVLRDTYGKVEGISDKYSDQRFADYYDPGDFRYGQTYKGFKEKNYKSIACNPKTNFAPSWVLMGNNFTLPKALPFDHKSVHIGTVMAYLESNPQWAKVGVYMPVKRPRQSPFKEKDWVNKNTRTRREFRKQE